MSVHSTHTQYTIHNYRPDRRIYYAFPFGGELEILHITLEEIYPEVDFIILLEATVTWRGDPKPVVFPKLNQSTNARYWDKIRYIRYSFEDPVMADRLSRCMTERVSGVKPVGATECRWLRQWGARDHLVTKGAYDIRDNDVFLIADLDELVSRRFLRALKHCYIWPDDPEVKVPESKCSRAGLHTFGHKYHFGCTINKKFGHFHPDLSLGRCLPTFGGEELRRFWGLNKKYFRKPPPDLLQDPKYIGPAGWHMHGFLSNSQVLWKWFSRSGSELNSKGTWTQKDLDEIKDKRRLCNEAKGFFPFDALGCEPLPALVANNPQDWQHMIKYVDDVERPDPFGVEQWYRDELIKRRDPNDPYKGEIQW